MTELDFYIIVLRAISISKPAEKPMWSVSNTTAYGIDNLELARELTKLAYVDDKTPEQTFEVVKSRECASRIRMIPSNVEFVVYNDKAT